MSLYNKLFKTIRFIKNPTKYIQNIVNQEVKANVEKELQKLGFSNMQDTRDDDIFLVGFPKSGNTWLSHIVAHLYYHLNYHQSRNIIELLIPDTHFYSYYKRTSRVCFFKTHDLPTERYKRVIYIYRDGRDALLSYFYMQKNFDEDISMDYFFHEDSQIFPSKWHEHIEQWFKNPFKAEILYVKYEDLVLNPHPQLKRISEFIKSKYHPEFIDYVVNQTSFFVMQNLEKKDLEWQKRKKEIGWNNQNLFVRKGKVGNYSKEVPNHLVEEFNQYSKKTLIKLGYNLD